MSTLTLRKQQDQGQLSLWEDAEEQLRASYATTQGRPLIERGIQVERAVKHTLQRNRSLESMVT